MSNGSFKLDTLADAAHFSRNNPPPLTQRRRLEAPPSFEMSLGFQPLNSNLSIGTSHNRRSTIDYLPRYNSSRSSHNTYPTAVVLDQYGNQLHNSPQLTQRVFRPIRRILTTFNPRPTLNVNHSGANATSQWENRPVLGLPQNALSLTFTLHMTHTPSGEQIINETNVRKERIRKGKEVARDDSPTPKRRNISEILRMEARLEGQGSSTQNNVQEQNLVSSTPQMLEHAGQSEGGEHVEVDGNLRREIQEIKEWMIEWRKRDKRREESEKIIKELLVTWVKHARSNEDFIRSIWMKYDPELTQGLEALPMRLFELLAAWHPFLQE